MQHGADARDRQVALEVLLGVPAECPDPIAFRHAQRSQRAGQPVDPRNHVSERRTPLALLGQRHDLGLRVDRPHPPEHMRERQREVVLHQSFEHGDVTISRRLSFCERAPGERLRRAAVRGLAAGGPRTPAARARPAHRRSAHGRRLTVPPCASTIARTIASPSPAPPDARLRAGSGRWKRSKIRSRSAAGIPGPSSMTANRTRSAAAPARPRAVRARRAAAVCSIALRARLRNACARRSGSASSVPSGSGSSSNRRDRRSG